MPVTKSAKKKMRVDERRRVVNMRVRRRYKKVVREARKNPTTENVKKAFSELDTAAKKHVIHKNKAARLKSRLAKGSKKQVAK